MHLDALASRDIERLDHAIGICRNLVLHLHGLEDEQDIASLDCLALGSDELHDLARHRRVDGVLSSAGCDSCLRRCRRSGGRCLRCRSSLRCRCCLDYGLDLFYLYLLGGAIDRDVELFHCIDSIRLNSSPIIGRWITYHNDTLFCEKCAGCFVARLLAFANTPRRSGYRLRRYALLRVPMCSTV